MSAVDLKKSIQSEMEMWNYFVSLDGGQDEGIEQIRCEIITLIEQERKAAVDEYIAANKSVGACHSIDEKQRDKRQLIIELAKAALSGLNANPESWPKTDEDIINLAIDQAVYAAERLNGLDL